MRSALSRLRPVATPRGTRSFIDDMQRDVMDKANSVRRGRVDRVLEAVKSISLTTTMEGVEENLHVAASVLERNTPREGWTNQRLQEVGPVLTGALADACARAALAEGTLPFAALPLPDEDEQAVAVAAKQLGLPQPGVDMDVDEVSFADAATRLAPFLSTVALLRAAGQVLEIAAAADEGAGHPRPVIFASNADLQDTLKGMAFGDTSTHVHCAFRLFAAASGRRAAAEGQVELGEGISLLGALRDGARPATAAFLRGLPKALSDTEAPDVAGWLASRRAGLAQPLFEQLIRRRPQSYRTARRELDASGAVAYNKSGNAIDLAKLIANPPAVLAQPAQDLQEQLREFYRYCDREERLRLRRRDRWWYWSAFAGIVVLDIGLSYS